MTIIIFMDSQQNLKLNWSLTLRHGIILAINSVTVTLAKICVAGKIPG